MLPGLRSATVLLHPTEDEAYRGLILSRLDNLESLLVSARSGVTSADAFNVLQDCYVGINDLRKAYGDCVPVTESIDKYHGHLSMILESIELRVKQALTALRLPVRPDPPLT